MKMKLKKGMKILFVKKNEIETIQKANNNIYTGYIKTDKKEYSTDFIFRWIEFGFIKIVT